MPPSRPPDASRATGGHPSTAAGPRPNFFIVGAPRCGTTALHQYLSRHPAIFMSEPKEPLYWADDFPRANQSSYTPLHALGEYLALFANAGPDKRVIGEATATYLYSRHAIPRIHEFTPDAKYVVLLRNPVDLVYSWHAELLYNYYEEEQDFSRAWDLQGVRAQGQSIPPNCLVPEFLQYEQVGRLGAQVERMLSVVPRGQVKLLLFDDFTERTRDVYLDVLTFLGLEDDGRKLFNRINATKRVRFRALGQTLFNPPSVIGPVVRRVRRLYARSDPRLKRALAKLLRKEVPRPALAPEMRARLREVFREDVRKLGRLLERDLSAWLEEKPERTRAASPGR